MPQKPKETVPELLRKKAERKGELDKLSKEFSKDGREVTEPEFKQLEDLSAEVREGGSWDEQIEARKRWDTIDGAISNGQTRVRESDHLPNEDGNNVGTRHSYSMMKALRAAAGMEKLDGLELETHQEMLKQRVGLPRGARGIQIPLNLPVNALQSLRYASRHGVDSRQLNQMMRTRLALGDVQRNLGQEQRFTLGGQLDTTSGGGSIPTILDTTMIEILRARMVTFNLGAKVMTDMQGLFAIPRQATASTFYMVGQGSNITASNQTIEQVPFSPHTGGVNTQYTRQFLEQTNQDAEMFVREDHAAVIARGVETQAFNGQGSAGYPLGLLNQPQIGVYALNANGAAPSWTQIVAQEAYVAFYSADVGSMAYVTDALIRGTLKTTAKIGSTFPIYLWNTEAPEYPVNGYPCAVTNLLPQNISKGTGTNLHTMIFGDWEALIFAFWSGMDVIVDPYTSAASGAVNLITLQDFDVNERHYQSFANCLDIVSSITAPTT